MCYSLVEPPFGIVLFCTCDRQVLSLDGLNKRSTHVKRGHDSDMTAGHSTQHNTLCTTLHGDGLCTCILWGASGVYRNATEPPAGGRLDGVDQLSMAGEDVYDAVRSRRSQERALRVPREDHWSFSMMPRIYHEQRVHCSVCIPVFAPHWQSLLKLTLQANNCVSTCFSIGTCASSRSTTRGHDTKDEILRRKWMHVAPLRKHERPAYCICRCSYR